MPPITRTFMQQYYMEQLERSEPSERIAALEALSARNDAALLRPVAVRLLADPAPGVREQAARVLVALADPEAAAATAPLIAHADIGVRNLAGDVLARMGRPAVDALRPYLDAPDKDVRKFAVDVLALLPAGPVAPFVAVRLADPDPNVVLAAVDALGRLRASAYAADLRALYVRMPAARPNVVAALGAMGGTRHLRFLEAALDDADPVVQLAAAEALAGVDAAARDTAGDTARDTAGDAAARVHALGALLRKVDAVDAMARPVLLSGIVRLLAQAGGAPALPAGLRAAFEAMLDDPDPDYRRAAVHGLRYFLDAAPHDALADVLVERLLGLAGADDAVDAALFATLAGYPNAFARLCQAVDDDRLTAPAAVPFVLGLLAQGRVPEAAFADVARFLCTPFRLLDADARLAALDVARRLDHPAFQDLLREGLDDLDPAVRTFAREATRDLELPPAPRPISVR